MSSFFSSIFTGGDRLAMKSLDLRSTNAKVISGNIANAETPGYRAIGYEFEEQLQAASGLTDNLKMTGSNPRHIIHPFARADGSIDPEVFIRPTESIANDGNTVDIDQEMSELAKNDILFRSAVEMINRKIAVLRYAISAGGR